MHVLIDLFEIYCLLRLNNHIWLILKKLLLRNVFRYRLGISQLYEILLCLLTNFLHMVPSFAT